eukprot:TRINITY_DN10162_c0_g1_i2.p1 TRINITY_DN10162_c0_g1~~TRINITY_DN10162_c0_g1_i2.p1  ORF type:complete len:264 (-),score=-13.10 TRINITY_DN10162_c0_g1_i2:30-821(-)
MYAQLKYCFFFYIITQQILVKQNQGFFVQQLKFNIVILFHFPTHTQTFQNFKNTRNLQPYKKLTICIINCILVLQTKSTLDQQKYPSIFARQFLKVFLMKFKMYVIITTIHQQLLIVIIIKLQDVLKVRVMNGFSECIIITIHAKLLHTKLNIDSFDNYKITQRSKQKIFTKWCFTITNITETIKKYLISQIIVIFCKAVTAQIYKKYYRVFPHKRNTTVFFHIKESPHPPEEPSGRLNQKFYPKQFIQTKELAEFQVFSLKL